MAKGKDAKKEKKKAKSKDKLKTPTWYDQSPSVAADIGKKSK